MGNSALGFIDNFRKTRKEQKGEGFERGTFTIYAQVDRYEHLREHLEKIYPVTSNMKKSEYFDFLIFLLENFMGNFDPKYVTFNQKWEISKKQLHEAMEQVKLANKKKGGE